MEKANKKTKKAQNTAKNILSSNPLDDINNQVKQASEFIAAKIEQGHKNNPYKKTQTKKTVQEKRNPFSTQTSFSAIVETINHFNTTIAKPKISTSRETTPEINNNINYPVLMKNISDAFQNNTSVINLFAQLNDIFVNKLNWNFIGYGLFHEKSKCINLKLHCKTGESYNSKIFLSDVNNPIIECFTKKKIIEKDSVNYLNIPYLTQTDSVLVPMVSVNKVIGVFLIGKNITSLNINFITFMANYTGMFIHNSLLLEQTNKYANTDTLTSLYTHRGFQEVLAKELEKAKDNGKPLSVIMFDVNNLTKINRELGHAKGDEVIKIIADKVKQNIKNSDSAGRYGGDEIAVIMPETDTRNAKYMAEYITYSLSCCFVDDVGPVKVSVGVATYPDSAQDQEKLLLLAEQAMFISQAKGYKEGMSAIVSSEDFNFWDDVAINSFAEILAKRHFENGINFEDELVKKINNAEIISHNNLMEMVTSLAGAIDAKDPYTKGHSTSVSRYSEALARAINLPEADVERIKIGAMLHDIGKIGIPENVLKKPGKLDDNEWKIMKQHPTIGAEKVLAPNEALREFIPIVKHHHERLDGKGYPNGLKGEDIPLEARIVSVADAYHALVSDRPYRKGMTIENACSILQEGAGIQWDSDLVRVFITIAPSLTTSV